jgi:hypothetical protein
MESFETRELRATNVRDRVEGLPTKDRKNLLEVWEEVFPSPPPPKLRKELMVPILAYRIQELEFGGLSQTARRQLELLIAKNQTKLGPANRPKPAVAPAKLIRGWRGEVHEVLIVDGGFIYRSETFKSLSPIAKRITGTPWSGPAFFGTRPKDRKS